MPRLHQVNRAEADALAEDGHRIVATMYGLLFDDRDPVADPGTATGTPGDWWTVFANVPDVLEHAVQGFALYQSLQRQLDPVLRELGQARAGYAAGSQFVYSQHCKSLRGLGVSEERIAAVAHWAAADCFAEVERLVLAYTDCLVLELGRVPDALFAALRTHLSDAELLELTYITTLYLQHAVMSKALRTEFDDVDERLVEVRVADAEDAILRITAEDG
jgi:alkylhydroperoxidase family enzyme